MAGIFDEMQGDGGAVRDPYGRIVQWLRTLGKKDVAHAM